MPPDPTAPVNDEPAARPSFSLARRWGNAANVGLAAAACLALVVMGNYLSSRHYLRGAWLADERYQLSPLTLRMLESLTNEVSITVLFDPQEPVFNYVKGLLNQYQLNSPRLQVEYIDYIRAAGRAALAKTRHKLSSVSDKNLVLFESGGRTRVVYENELSDYDMSRVIAAKEIRRVAFKGEQLFSSAIAAVADPRPFNAFFLTGHGEHNPASDDDLAGYQRFARLLEEKNVRITPLSLVTNDVPADCQLLVIAGPRHPLAGTELERLGRYLSRGGHALILLPSPFTGARRSGLEHLLADWGVDVGDNLVLDRAGSPSGQSATVFITRYGQHPIVTPLAGAQMVLAAPRSIRPRAGAADTLKIVELATTTDRGQSLTGVRDGQGTVETNGLIPLMVAVEKGAVQGVKTDSESTRLVVVGDSFFLGNSNLDAGANHDFANLAVNWLLNRSHLLAIGPRPVTGYRFALTHRQMLGARWILVGAMPGAVMVVGFLVWLRRRR